MPWQHAAGMLFNDFAQTGSHGEFETAGPIHFSTHTIELRSGTRFGLGQPLEPVRAPRLRMCGTLTRVSILFRMVGNPTTPFSVERMARLHGMRPLSLDGIDLGRAFAANIPTPTAVDDNIKGEVAAENILAQEACLPGNSQLSFENQSAVFVGGSNENDPLFAETA